MKYFAFIIRKKLDPDIQFQEDIEIIIHEMCRHSFYSRMELEDILSPLSVSIIDRLLNFKTISTSIYSDGEWIEGIEIGCKEKIRKKIRKIASDIAEKRQQKLKEEIMNGCMKLEES